MRDFWDARAQEDAWFFVDDRLEYGAPDVERFWADGERILDVLLSAAGAELHAGDEVVDVGCGLGRLSRAVAGRVAKVRAIDISPQMLAQAREHNAHVENIEWILGDGTSLHPIADASADAITSHVVFQHIPDPQVTLGYVRDMGRVLRPGGWAAFQISNDPRVHQGLGGLSGLRRRAAALVGRAPKGQDDPAWLGSAIDLDELRAAAADGGLTVDRVENPGTQFCLVRLSKPLSRPAGGG
jgi:SAM-dependent methyltransferase